MDYLNTIAGGISTNTHTVYNTIMAFLPKLVVAVVIALAGYFIAVVLKKITVQISKKLNLDSIISKTNLDEQLKEAGIKMNISKFLGESAKWIILIITLLFVTGMFDSLSVVKEFVSSILNVIGNIIVALFILVVAVYAARFAGAIASAVAKYVEIKNTNTVSIFVKVVIYLFAIITILDVIGGRAVSELIISIIEATVFGLALAVGIAFGFGGQERAKEIIDK